MTLYCGFEFTSFFMLPQIMNFFNFKVFSGFGDTFIKSSIAHVITEREKSGNKRNDLIDTLIELKHTDDGEKKLTMDMLVAQAAVFFTAGYETSSPTQSFALYQIAKDEDVQEKLRSEISEMLVRTWSELKARSLMMPL